MLEEIMAYAGCELSPQRRNTGYALINQFSVSCWVSDGTTLLIPTRSCVIIRWLAPAGQDLFAQVVQWPSGAIESANDFLRRLLEAQLCVYVMTVPEKIRREEPDQMVISYSVENGAVHRGGKWRQGDEILMSTVLPLGGSF